MPYSGESRQNLAENQQTEETDIGIKATFKNEFRRKNFRLQHHSEAAFYRTQWGLPVVVLLAWRAFIVLYVTAWLVFSVCRVPVWKGHVWPAFLTNWSYTLLDMYLVMALVVLCRRTAWTRHGLLTRPGPTGSEGQPDETSTLSRDREKRLPVDIRMSWLLFIVISNFAFIVTLLYFGFIYPALHGPGDKLRPVDFHIHGLNSIIIVIEMLLCAYPVKLAHCIYPIMYGLSYIFFSIIYWAVDHDNVIYTKMLDWNLPGQTILVIFVVGFIILPLIQLGLFGLYHLRIWLCKRVNGNHYVY